MDCLTLNIKALRCFEKKNSVFTCQKVNFACRDVAIDALQNPAVVSVTTYVLVIVATSQCQVQLVSRLFM
jgi:catabolite regulation protein CreA